ncbi:juvenile hormone epoxide hydrolase-like [Bicyclus anynana]|uniref:Epoxide hydrolase n=1 Tax=Bicyclus anynana TaxID=110368 RepID=A0A6J1NBK7_BICAN|nr:juvenile hormone epoxide hydrolase-like [Bicyclus anynana]
MCDVTRTLALLLAVVALAHAQAPSLAPLEPDEWWGPTSSRGHTDTSIRDFRVEFDDDMIQDLRNRLWFHRPLTPPLQGVGFRYGCNTTVLQPWVDYWANEYNFTQRAEYFNQFPHYKTNIQGLDIHFIHVKPKLSGSSGNIKVVPLLILHGRPGSIREFYDAIPALSSPYEDYPFVFELIVPSLPGFGFSDAPVRRGAAPPQLAVIFKNLMARLGHDKFYVQGGEWGSYIGSALATLYPDNVLGFHCNLLSMQNSCTETKSLATAMLASMQLSSAEAAKIANIANLIEETGNIHIHGTKPETLGAGLSDSPVGFLCYSLEKFAFGTNQQHRDEPDGGLSLRFSKEELLDNIMLYWSTNTVTTSMRLYREFFSNKNRALAIDDFPTPVPTWSVQAPNVFVATTKSKLKFPNLLGITELDNGGHFLAFELPKVFTDKVFLGIKAIMDFRNTKTEL